VRILSDTTKKKNPSNCPDCHDECTLEVAKALKSDNWDVKANLPGWEKPDKIGPLIPDVEASKKGCMKRICQIATKEMFEGNEKNYRDFKNYCADYDFQFFMIKDGKRVPIDPATFGKENKK
jgi:hypothetical protein